MQKKAVLHYELIGHITDHYLLQIMIETGRPHQIRAQLASMKCPITGDAKYGYPHILKDKGIATPFSQFELLASYHERTCRSDSPTS